MGKVRTLINNHPLAAFLIVAYGFSWGIWGLLTALTGHIHWIGSFGPSIAAVVVVAIGEGKDGLRNLLRPIRQWRFGLGWYIFILIGCPLIFALGLWAYILSGGVFSLSSDAIINQLIQVPIYYLIILIIGGPLGEEIGWRGFALPRLLEHKSSLMASFYIFLMWFVWHLPLFWLPGAGQQGSPIGVYVLMIAAWSILFTWVYIGTSGSLWSALLLHTSINTFSNFASGVDPAHANGPLWAYAIVFAVLALVIVLMRKQRMQAPDKAVA